VGTTHNGHTTDLLGLISRDVALQKVAATNGGEYAGPCPFCHAGDDRLRVWPSPPSGTGRWWCRVCDRCGDAITYVRLRDGLGFGAACRQLELGTPQSSARREPVIALPPELVVPPPLLWQQQAQAVVHRAKRALWPSTGQRPFDWLRGRGLTRLTVLHAELGYHPDERWDAPGEWGLSGEHAKVWLPRGIVVPWFVDGVLWKLVIRRPHDNDGRGKYIAVSGSSNALYCADTLVPGKSAIITEGVFDALAVQQVAGDLVAAVATGTTWARRMRWITRLALCRPILVAHDADGAGEVAANYWCDVLHPHAHRWRPLVDDPATMLACNVDLRAWIEAGLQETTHIRS
jgi:DNA primase